MKFHTGDVLSVTTGVLLSPTLMDGIYKILNFMTNDNLFTHQLPRAARECAPYLLKQFPQLATLPYPEVDDQEVDDPMADEVRKTSNKIKWMDWLDEQVKVLGEEFDVQPIPMDDHEYKDLIQEMIEMRGGRVEDVIVIQVDTNQPPPYGYVAWKVNDDDS